MLLSVIAYILGTIKFFWDTEFLRFSGYYSSYYYIESYNECMQKIEKRKKQFFK